MACLFCRYFQAIEPEKHRAAREARGDHCVSRWNNNGDAIAYVVQHREYIDGWCMRHPEPKVRRCSVVCGEIELATRDFWARYKTPTAVPADSNLSAWAKDALDTLLTETWQEREHREQGEDVVRLKRELAAARKISRSRLERLQKLEPKKPKKTVEQPVVLSLVDLKDAAD